MTEKKPTHQIIVTIGNTPRKYLCTREEMIVGREEDADVVIPDLRISRKHLKIRITESGVQVEDLASQNGSFIGSVRLKAREPRQLKPGESVKVGPSGVLVSVEAFADSVVYEHESTTVGRITERVPEFPIQPDPSLKLELEDPIRRAPAKETQESEGELNRLKNKIAAIEQQRDALVREVAEDTRLKKSLEEDLSAKRRELEDLEARLESLQVQADAWVARAKELESRAREAEDRLEAALAKNAEIERERESLESQCEKLGAKASELKASASSEKEQLKKVQQAKQDAEAARMQEEEGLKKAREQKESALSEIQAQQDTLSALRREEEDLHARVGDAAKQLRASRVALAAEKEKQKSEMQERETEMRKKRAELEALEAETRASALKIQVELESNRVLKATLEKEIRLAEMARDDIREEKERILHQSEIEAQKRAAEVAEHEKRMKMAELTLAELENRAEESSKLRQSIEAEIASAKQRKVEADSEAEIAFGKLEAIRDDNRKVLAELRAEIVSTRKILEAEKAAAREALAQEMQSRRADAEAEHASFRKEMEDKLAYERRERHGQLEAELARKRLDEEEKLAHQREVEEKNFKDRRRSAAHDVAQAISRLMGTHAQATITAPLVTRAEKESFEAALRALSSEPSVADTAGAAPTAEDRKRVKSYWKRVGAAGGSIAAALFLFALFPKAPAHVSSRIFRSISSEGAKDNNVFLEEIKKKGERFHPAQDRNYRDNYTDNVLYLEGYVAMKTDEAAQKRWTLALNDFLVGRLGLSDRVIVDFVTEESFLVKQLDEQGSSILPEYKDSSIQKMREFEAPSLKKLQNLLGGPENYAKFRGFEQAFYQDYIGRAKP